MSTVLISQFGAKIRALFSLHRLLWCLMYVCIYYSDSHFPYLLWLLNWLVWLVSTSLSWSLSMKWESEERLPKKLKFLLCPQLLISFQLLSFYPRISKKEQLIKLKLNSLTFSPLIPLKFDSLHWVLDLKWILKEGTLRFFLFLHKNKTLLCLKFEDIQA